MSFKQNSPVALLKLIENLSRLPGIGKRSAERIATSLLAWPEEQLIAFGEDLKNLRQRIKPCQCCGNYAEEEFCVFCNSAERQRELICIVENASQIAVIEKSNVYQGLYHVLGGKLSPLNDKGPADLRISELHERLKDNSVKELIIATSPDMEGEATALFLLEELRSYPLLISRIAVGIPAGADLGYSDSATLSLALKGRRQIN